MTNYEWLVKEYPDLVSEIMAGKDNCVNCVSGIALGLDGTPCLCINMVCPNCRFGIDNRKNKKSDCTSIVLNWLKEKHIEYIYVSDIKELKEAFYKFKKETNNISDIFTLVEIEDFLDRIVITGGKENDKS